MTYPFLRPGCLLANRARLLLLGSTALALTSCSAARAPHGPAVAPPPLPNTTLANQAPVADTLLPTGPEPEAAPGSWLSRVLRPQRVAAGPVPPRKCKGCTFYYGPATVTAVGKKATVATAAGATAAATGKRSGPAVVAATGSPLTAGSGGGNVAAVNGHSNHLAQTAITPAAPGPLAALVSRLAGPLGYVLAAAAAAGLGWLLLAWRRRRNEDGK